MIISLLFIIQLSISFINNLFLSFILSCLDLTEAVTLFSELAFAAQELEQYFLFFASQGGNIIFL